MTEIIQASEQHIKAWNNYCRSVQHASFYFHYNWRKVLEKSFGYKCFYLMAMIDNNVQGIFPLVYVKSRLTAPALVSIPFFNYGGILASEERVISLLMEEALTVSKEIGALYIEARHLKKLNDFSFTKEHKVTMWLGLDNKIEAQWKNLNQKVRNQVRKAEKMGLEINIGKDELLHEFYKIFRHNMRDLGTPVIGFNFFCNVFKLFPEEAAVFIVRKGSKNIGGAITISNNNVIEIPWASSLRKYSKYCPNIFMYWEILKFSIMKSFKKIDFGRCSKDSGTYRFKKQWNPQIVQLYWQYLADRESNIPKDDPQSGRLQICKKIWQNLPLAITDRVGPYIAREIPFF